jgi:hypothetical protein
LEIASSHPCFPTWEESVGVVGCCWVDTKLLNFIIDNPHTSWDGVGTGPVLRKKGICEAVTWLYWETYVGEFPIKIFTVAQIHTQK